VAPVGPRTHAHAEIGRWRSHYNTKRPHSALGYLSPTEFLIKTTAPALETLAVSTLPLKTQSQPEESGPTRLQSRGRSVRSRCCRYLLHDPRRRCSFGVDDVRIGALQPSSSLSRSHGSNLETAAPSRVAALRLEGGKAWAWLPDYRLDNCATRKTSSTCSLHGICRFKTSLTETQPASLTSSAATGSPLTYVHSTAVRRKWNRTSPPPS